MGEDIRGLVIFVFVVLDEVADDAHADLLVRTRLRWQVRQERFPL